MKLFKKRSLVLSQKGTSHEISREAGKVGLEAGKGDGDGW